MPDLPVLYQLKLLSRTSQSASDPTNGALADRVLEAGKGMMQAMRNRFIKAAGFPLLIPYCNDATGLRAKDGIKVPGVQAGMCRD